MIDLRLYRLSFVPALVAVVVVMFSLEGAPAPLEPVDPPTTFEGDRAAALARQIANTAPEREAGSAGDARIADLVAERFEESPGAVVSEQLVEASIDGDDVTLRNVLLTLTGDAPETIVIVAARDSARGPGTATSAAATGILIELANALRVSHERTFVLASVSGSAEGAEGARALIENLPEPDLIDAVIVVFQPGPEARTPPFAVGTSDAETSPNAQLVRTVEGTVEVQAGEASPSVGAFTQLARLAIPSGLGDQAPLVGSGVPAVAISAAGERPLEGAAADDLSARSVDEFGRAIQSTIDALDDAVGEPVHGPDAYLELGDNLLPGWVLALLAAMLILPALVAAGDGCARGARGDTPIGSALAWAAARSLPFVGALAALYALALIGVIPRPGFPFDPALYGLGGRAAVAFAVILLAAGASAWLLHSRLSARRAPEGAGVALGGIAALAAAGLWLANPYLALLFAPAAHVWVLREIPRTSGPVAVIAAAAIACVLPVAALAAVTGALDLGGDAPWTFTLMVADGQIGLMTTLCVSFLVGTLAGLCALAIARARPLSEPNATKPPARA